MILSPLFHWSPADRRADILRDGLVLHAPPVVHSDPGLSAPYICLSPSPSEGWKLSGDMAWVSEIDDWDLWQVSLPDNAEVRVRPNWGPGIEEVKVFTPIGADCIWLVGTRTSAVFEEIARG